MKTSHEQGVILDLDLSICNADMVIVNADIMLLKVWLYKRVDLSDSAI